MRRQTTVSERDAGGGPEETGPLPRWGGFVVCHRPGNSVRSLSLVLAALLLFPFASAVDPTTGASASVNAAAYSFGTWTNYSVSITLSCNAGSSDCSAIFYCVDTSNACDPTSAGTVYNAPFNITTEGVSYLRYASNNSNASWGDTGSSTLEIDTTAPLISISDDTTNYWTNLDPIAVSVSDSGSGISNTVWVARSDSDCGPTQDSELDSGTSGTSMQANDDALYQGKYICFRTTDAVGNKNYAVSSQIVHLDTTAPTVNAGTDQSANSRFTQNGAASDSQSGVSTYAWSEVSGPGTVSFGSPDEVSTTVSASADGYYEISLNATDSAGNSGSDTFALEWITTAPTISISNPDSTPAQSKTISASVPSGTLSMAVTTGSACDASISFVLYAPITFSAETDNGKSVCYRVADSLGNIAYLRSALISGIDTTKPVLIINGNPAVTIEVHSPYSDGGASASDNHDSALSPKIRVNNSVNSDKIGTYSVTYDVADAAGNHAVQLVRSVRVVDTTKPVITLLGNSSMHIEIRTNFTDPQATATDNYDGDITSKIIQGGSVNPNAAGTYNITYDVTDSSGNKAAQLIRTVTVTDSLFGLLMGLAILFAGLAALVVIGLVVLFFFLRKKGKL